MSYLQFIKFEQVTGEKHLGIATVKVYSKVILRFRVINRPDGKGFFCVSGSYKMPSTPGEKDKYLSCFVMDSTSENEELQSFLNYHVNLALQKGMQKEQSSSFSMPPMQAQAPQNHYANSSPQMPYSPQIPQPNFQFQNNQNPNVITEEECPF